MNNKTFLENEIQHAYNKMTNFIVTSLNQNNINRVSDNVYTSFIDIIVESYSNKSEVKEFLKEHRNIIRNAAWLQHLEDFTQYSYR